MKSQHLESLIDIDQQRWEECKKEHETERKEQLKTIACTMKADGLLNVLIAEYLGITDAEIETLLKE